MLTNIESDQEELINEEEVKTLQSINQPFIDHNDNEEDLEDEQGSLTESDELSMIGEDLVNRSLAEVTSLLDRQIDLNGDSKRKHETATEKRTQKRISFLVPTTVPNISVSSAGSADES